ncbi:hypothetical protein BH09ACT6_BH09ACT6_24790 [soil metagenome]
MKWLVRALVLFLVRLYYPARSSEGRARVGEAPVIFAPNHPNALLDPLVLRLAVGGPVAFLAKSTLFSNVLTRFVLGAFDAIPVYRQRDDASDRPAAASREDKNEATFAQCRSLLAAGGKLALFPEGTSHSDPTLKPLRTGAARIALSAEAEHGFAMRLRIVPVGLFYEAKSTFRSRAHVVFGTPISIAAYRDRHHADPRAAAAELTADIRRAMDDVVLQATTRELLDGATRLAFSLDEDARELGERHEHAKRLLDGYRVVSVREPARTEALVERCRRYLATMTLLGIDDPWTLEMPSMKKRTITLRAFALAFSSPFALGGALLGWIPYRLAGRVAARVTAEEDVLGTTKLLGGALFLLVAWALEASFVGLYFGLAAGLTFAPLAALLGLVALLWDESFGQARLALRALFLRRDPMVRELAAERAAIARDVSALLDVSAP